MKSILILCTIAILGTCVNTTATFRGLKNVLNSCRSLQTKYNDTYNLCKMNNNLHHELLNRYKNDKKLLDKDWKQAQELYEKELNINKLHIDRINCLSKDLNTTRDLLNSTQLVVSDLTNQLEGNRTILREKETTIENNVFEINSLKDAKRKLETRISGLTQNLEKIESDNNELRESLQKNSFDITEKNDIISKQQEKLDLDGKEIERLKEIIGSYASYTKASSCDAFGSSTNIHVIQVNGSDPFQVLCNGKLHGTGWTVIQRRINDHENFYRGWAEYKKGFGSLTGSFFIGLDKLHLMTSAEKQHLVIHLEDFENTTRYIMYDDFQVGDESDSYMLRSLGDSSGDLSDELGISVGQKFSTFDRDNDILDKNCAAHHRGAWWYRKCGTSNLNGEYQDKFIGSDQSHQGIFWLDDDWHDSMYSMKTVIMMIRPKNHQIEVDAV